MLRKSSAESRQNSTIYAAIGLLECKNRTIIDEDPERFSLSPIQPPTADQQHRKGPFHLSCWFVFCSTRSVAARVWPLESHQTGLAYQRVYCLSTLFSVSLPYGPATASKTAVLSRQALIPSYTGNDLAAQCPHADVFPAGFERSGPFKRAPDLSKPPCGLLPGS